MHHINRLGSDHGYSGDSSGGAKRPFEKIQGDNVQGTPLADKRQRSPDLASVVVEAVENGFQKLCLGALEPLLRRVVGEEVERALARVIPSSLGSRTPPRQLQESPMSDLRLDFRTKLSLPLFTGAKVEGEGGLPIHIVLKDGSTGKILTTGPASSAKLDIVVLDGDFANEEEEWTSEDFENHVVKEREGKRPLLTGNLSVTLKEGVGTLGEISFTDNSSWIRSRKFKLGVRVAPGCYDGIRIQECKTDAFIVKDHRGELYKKHYPPLLLDEVWRLDNIRKDGAFHKKLQQSGIKTVEDFLRCYVRDHQSLRNILGNGMPNKMWEATVEHAKTCAPSGKLYVYYEDEAQSVGVIFNHIYELMGVTFYNTYKTSDSLTDKEKPYVDKLVKAAYDNWDTHVSEYENGDLGAETTPQPTVMQIENDVPRLLKEHASVYNQTIDLPPQPGQFQSVPRSTSHYPPLLLNDVRSLDKIGKDGAFHKKLQQSGKKVIKNVRGCYVRGPQNFRDVPGKDMLCEIYALLWHVYMELKDKRPSLCAEILLFLYDEMSEALKLVYNNTRKEVFIDASGSGSQLYGYGADRSPTLAALDSQVMQSNQFYSPEANQCSQTSPTISPEVGFPAYSTTGLALGFSQGVSSPHSFCSTQPSQAVLQGSCADWQRYMTQNPVTPSLDVYFNEDNLWEKTLEVLSQEEMQQLPRSQCVSQPEHIQIQEGDAWLNRSPSVPYGGEGIRSTGEGL